MANAVFSVERVLQRPAEKVNRVPQYLSRSVYTAQCNVLSFDSDLKFYSVFFFSPEGELWRLECQSRAGVRMGAAGAVLVGGGETRVTLAACTIPQVLSFPVYKAQGPE